MKKQSWRIGVFVVVLLLLIGCSVSEEEAIERGRQVFVGSIEQEQLETNFEKDQIQIHLPRGFEVMEEMDYNLLLEENGQLYNLLYDPFVPLTSTFHLERDMESAGSAIIYEVNETDEKISYLIVNEQEEEGQLHVITAVGGARITTVTTYQLLEESIEAMMVILHSYQVIES
ncbi:hypothetical protein [Halalkalibacter akibai]|uniref:Lipoprotein n=1 Tax=Halalkalibacter akibai (strain ATCC 43226 / DSM 21942 / CIP 109018 / JCM 9157 / 1139) TaxID=1236973 RepID=W4QQ32_HALA3|nr:hypothetical protein [Halalkalibacter akibai]GAE34186.1 hypothetical protein JCM9157_1229 [Halalkalibacter akibai JCM 9157]